MKRTEKTNATKPPKRGNAKPAHSKGLKWSNLRENYNKHRIKRKARNEHD